MNWILGAMVVQELYRDGVRLNPFFDTCSHIVLVTVFGGLFFGLSFWFHWQAPLLFCFCPPLLELLYSYSSHRISFARTLVILFFIKQALRLCWWGLLLWFIVWQPSDEPHYLLAIRILFGIVFACKLIFLSGLYMRMTWWVYKATNLPFETNLVLEYIQSFKPLPLPSLKILGIYSDFLIVQDKCEAIPHLFNLYSKKQERNILVLLDTLLGETNVVSLVQTYLGYYKIIKTYRIYNVSTSSSPLELIWSEHDWNENQIICFVAVALGKQSILLHVPFHFVARQADHPRNIKDWIHFMIEQEKEYKELLGICTLSEK